MPILLCEYNKFSLFYFQLFEYCESADPCLVDISWQVLIQVSVRENNAFKLLYHDIVIKIFNILLDQEQARLHECAALTLSQVLTF